MPAYITSMATAVPPTHLTQAQIADFLADSLQAEPSLAQHIHLLFRAAGIAHRHTVLPDYAKPSHERQYDFRLSTAARMQLYKQHAAPLAAEAATKCLQNTQKNELTHLVWVSCTGMYAPGPEIDLIHLLQLPQNVHRTSVNFMGCYGAFNGLKVADSICRAYPDAKVLVVCTELCSLHFSGKPEPDHLLADALFADGAAAVLVESRPQNRSIALQHFACDLLPQGQTDMTWHIADHGFDMRLSTYVPALIGEGILPLLQRVAAKMQVNWADINHWAIHPGGKKILAQVRQALQLHAEATATSAYILKQYGNMSSATVLFVLAQMLQEATPQNHGQPIFSMAFGPGLTIESALMQFCVV